MSKISEIGYLFIQSGILEKKQIEECIKDSVSYLSETYNLDFSKTVAWNRRPMKKKDKNIKFRFLSELPPKVLDRWSGYYFINLGSQFGEGDVYDYLFDLDTSIWLLKECAAYVGSDSGTTHLAMAVKDPKDIYLYGENPEGEKTKTIWSMNSYENTGINFLG